MHSTTFDYLKPTADQQETMRVVRTNFRMLADVISQMVPDSRYKSLTMTALEEAAMWANKGITRCNNGAPRDGAEVQSSSSLAIRNRAMERVREMASAAGPLVDPAQHQGEPLPILHGALDLTAGEASIGPV